MKTTLLAVIALLLGGILAFMVVTQQQEERQEQREREVAVCVTQHWRLLSACLMFDYGWELDEATDSNLSGR